MEKHEKKMRASLNNKTNSLNSTNNQHIEWNCAEGV